MDAPATTIRLTSPDQTAALAHRFAARVRPGDTLLLTGPIGAGKTLFARALIQAKLSLEGMPVEDVPSPTFTLVQTYFAGDDEIWHADLYRLTHPDEVEELGLIDAFDTAICLVEWPDRLGDLRPTGAVELSFASEDDADTRIVTVAGLPPHLSDAIETEHG
ncbi:MAG: tRNA (adenosine(37)-N6)-threonylcarbamoyltransferase complex ATPase subunit type 1 TsaE [Pseudomonadota bacterium]|nr:tRNA (adenosine(37)-N6)-threonylcarbamoyltransferase complex ATPase subunit type 1 TsaE [Pseudomonadota bacterium]